MPDENTETKHLSPQLRGQLKQLRLDAGLSQRQLGELVGLANSTVSMIENGSRDTGASTVEAWAAHCGGSVMAGRLSDDVVRISHLDQDGRKLIEDLVHTMPDLDAASRRTLRVIVSAWMAERR
jgi:transcriptional regulator with XRE-family HTH domain